MLTFAEAQKRTEAFLTGQMVEALRTVEYELPSFDEEPRALALADAARAQIEIRHVRGASDASYLVQAFSDELLMQLQLNVHRLVVVYRVPALDALDAATLAVRLERWRIGAEHAGWKFGWRGKKHLMPWSCPLAMFRRFGARAIPRWARKGTRCTARRVRRRFSETYFSAAPFIWLRKTRKERPGSSTLSC